MAIAICPPPLGNTRPRPRTRKRRTRRSGRPISPRRPTGRRYLDNDQARLYELIWKRTMASQASAPRWSARPPRSTSPEGRQDFRRGEPPVPSSASTASSRSTRKGSTTRTTRKAACPRSQGRAVEPRKIEAKQHFTEPPPRYTEATLVKRMEELGIGRPSTYASTMEALRDREYVASRTSA